MNKYYVDYGTGAGNFIFEGSLEEAMKLADEGLAYTQSSVVIKDYDTHEDVAMRRWYGVPPDDNAENNEFIIGFGNLGYYDDWWIICPEQEQTNYNTEDYDLEP